MKNIYLTLKCLSLVVAGIIYSAGAQAQCAYNNDIFLTWDASTSLVNVGNQVSSTCTVGGEYDRVTNMAAGNTYRISTCTNTAFDTQITIFTAGGGSVVAYDDDNCGLQTEIFFTPGTTGDYDIQINQYNCITNTTCMALVVELTAIASSVGCTSTGTNYPTGTFTPTTSFQTASTLVYGGDYSLYNVTAGNVYEWSYCTTDGGVASYDSQLSLYNNTNLAVGLAYADDVCDIDDAKITWTATFTGVARVITHEYSCQTNLTSSTLRYRLVGAQPPVNDNCSGSISLATSPVCTPLTGTTANATQSLPALSCDGFTSGASLDVWYSFVADNTTATVTVVGSADIDAVVEVLVGTCGAQSNVDCADLTVNAGTETVSLTGLTIGVTYYVRVYDFGTTLSTTFTFDICVVSTPAGPANDNCAGAISLTVGNGECNPVLGTVAGATQSPTTGCGTGTPNDDVWYSFVATGTTALVDVLGGAGFDAVMDIYVGTSCANITSIGCLDGSLDGELESAQVTGLTIGATYWIRVYDWYSGVPTGTDFTICVFNPCAVTVPVGATLEAEACGSDANGGCNMVTPAYQNIACNETISGTMWADTNLRDTDWYLFTVVANTTATFTGSSQIPFVIALIDVSNCGAYVVLSNGGLLTPGAACSTVSASAALTPGTYAAVIAPDDFNYYVCSGGAYNSYWATLTMTTTAPTVTVGGNTTFCQGGSVTLTSSTGSSYAWSPGGGTTQAISATTTGSYTVSVPDPNGCGLQTSTPAVSVTVNPTPATPTISAGGATTFCQGGSVTLTSSLGNSYLWSPGGATTASISATASGTYTVVVTGTGNCASASSLGTTVTVNPNPATPTISAGGNTTFCQGGSVTLTSSSASSYTWSPGSATTQAISASANGSYTVTVGDANGCTATSLATGVTVNPNPTASFSFVQNDPTVDFTGSATGGTPGYTYAWDFGDGNNGSGATTSHTYASPNTYTVQLCATDANGCVNCTTQTVSIITIGIADNASVSDLNIFPNPAHDVLNIVFNVAVKNNVEVRMMNSNGQLVYSEQLNQFSGKYTKQLNTVSFATGNYMLQIISESGITNRKIVVR